MKAVIFTGTRYLKKYSIVNPIFFKYKKEDIIIHGDCPNGLDRMIKFLSEQFDRNCISMPAQWDKHGNYAGPKRNQEMLNTLVALSNCGYEPFVEAFPHSSSKGTYNMIKKATLEIVKVNIHSVSDNQIFI